MQGFFPDPRRPPSKAQIQRVPNLFARLRDQTIALWSDLTRQDLDPDKPKPNTKNWSTFMWYFEPSMLLEGVVYGDGQHSSQEAEIPQHMVLHSQWYPAIFSNRMEGVLLWVRCEPLIVGNSRPWQTHISRLRLFDEAGNPVPLLPPPSYPPPPPWNQPPSTVVIEEEVDEEPTALMALPGCCRYSGCLAVMQEEVNVDWGWYCSLQCFIKEGLKMDKASKTKMLTC